ncbi:MAG: Holliday junction branch migration protein RuvA [Clostridiales bacterium]|jgi:Holliday junction DNA helicase RuvA|nr:Holliday junction branch migration protein RuvA [Clostridiales bacterium]
MYAYIKGKLEAKAADYVVVEAAGVGYRIFTSANTLASLPSAPQGADPAAADPAAGEAGQGGAGNSGGMGDAGNAGGMDGTGNAGGTGGAREWGGGRAVKLHTRLMVKEDAHTLYGFLTQEELGIFDILLTVSKVGPKVALALLSAITPSQFGLAVLTEDYGALTRAQGVGKKLAQTIVFELRDKLSKSQLVAQGARAGAAGGAAGAESAAERGKFSEAVSALMILGYKAADANRMVSASYEDGLDIEDIIRNALSSAGKQQ